MAFWVAELGYAGCYAISLPFLANASECTGNERCGLSRDGRSIPCPFPNPRECVAVISSAPCPSEGRHVNLSLNRLRVTLPRVQRVRNGRRKSCAGRPGRVDVAADLWMSSAGQTRESAVSSSKQENRSATASICSVCRYSQLEFDRTAVLPQDSGQLA